MNAISALAKSIANLVYPLRCAVCKKALEASNETGACSFCLGTIGRNPKPYCASCGRALDPSHVGTLGASSGRTIQVSTPGGSLCGDCLKARPSFAIARSACLYEGALKELVHLFKYRNRRSLAGLFARLMIDFLEDEAVLAESADLVTFVPLHNKRLRQRDFNQSKLLAQAIAFRLALPVTDCLEKIKETANQNELSREARLCNLKGAFRARGSTASPFRGCTILLVDDVMTTGATLDECARTLLDAGAREVRCLTLARGSS